MAGLEPPCDMPEIIKSADTQDKVIKAKVALENFYTNLLAQHSDRKNRLVLPDLHIYVTTKDKWNLFENNLTDRIGAC